MRQKKQKRFKSIIISLRGVIPFICVAAIIFAATVAIYFLLDRLISDSFAPEALTGWEYTYSDTADVKNTDSMKLYNSQNPIAPGEVKHDYIYFVKNVEASDEDRTIKIVTDHSPMMIYVNGFEVYNNRYSGDNAAEYVGNCYNSVTLEGNGRTAQVEILMRLPFSVKFEPTIATGAEDGSFEITFDLAVAAIIVLTGLLGAAVSFVTGAVKHRIGRSPVLFLMISFCGAADALCCIKDLTYYINDPIWLNLYTAVTVSSVFLCVVFLSKSGRKQTAHTVITLAAGAVSCFAVMYFRTPELYIYSSIFAFAAAAACAVAVAQSVFKAVIDREQYSATAYIAVVYYTLSILFSCAMLVIRSTGAFMFTSVASSVMLLITLIMLDHLFAVFEKGKAMLKAESEKYGECVNKLAIFVKNVLAYKDETGFFEEAPRDVAELVIAFSDDNAGIGYSAAKKEGTEWHEVFSCGVEGCRYGIIETTCLRERASCYFAGNYFDFLIKRDVFPAVIYHFEGLKSTFEEFFTDMIESAYTGLKTSYDNVMSEGTPKYDAALELLASRAESADGYSPSHMDNVSILAKETALKMGVDPERAELIGRASRLHDIGKMAIPPKIVSKEGRLSDMEREIVNQHTEYGYKILSAFGDDEYIKTAGDIARCHHERFDGKGELGMSGDSIPLCARIVAICDVFDALTSPRKYKRAWRINEALAEIKKGRGKTFDPDAVDAFMELRQIMTELKKESD
ncbi:MAG: HD-GYP domain-containing protein [Clostridia bacterium]|nr:HD-GYP domain-containing protein [Clostridia bacterium]